jgi:hypothetical protein
MCGMHLIVNAMESTGSLVAEVCWPMAEGQSNK